MVKEIILVGAGGFAGSALRYVVSVLMMNSVLFSVPSGTFTVNAVGSFLIGVFLSVLSSDNWYYLCVVGLCGGFTTFSTFSAEIVTMLKTGNYLTAGLYIVASVVICVLAVIAGMYIGGKLKFA